MNAGAKIGKFLKRHWLTGYVTMLNGFVYDAYWAEKIECAFGLLDQLQPKELSLASTLSVYSFCCSICRRSYS